MAQPYAPLLQQLLLEFQNQRHESVERIAHSILRINPKDGVALQIIGLSFAIQGNLIKAIEYLSKASVLDPKNPELLANLAKAEFSSELYEDAIKTFERMLRLNPRSFQILTDKGTAHGKLRQFDSAATCYDKALALMPNYYLAWSNYGNLWADRSCPDKAIECYEVALQHNPSYPETWTNYGNALFDLGRYEEARLSHERALTLDSQYGEAWSNLGNTLLELKMSEEALECYQKAYDIVPEHPFLIGLLYNLNRNIFNWEKSEPLGLHALDMASKMKSAFLPFILLQTPASSALQKLVAETFIRKRILTVNQNSFPELKSIANRKIRIGYFSSDFKEHPVGILMENVIRLHDRSRFEIYGYFLNKGTGDDVECQLSQLFDNSCNLFGLTDEAAHKLIAEHNIDIAVDLNGHTDGSRTALFSRKISPIQVNYLGYAGTSGADFYQYLIADKIALPQDQQAHFSETIKHLPNSFFPADSSISLDELSQIPSRKSQGLSENSFIFSCFNNAYKISPQIFTYWMRLLNEVENSLLWLAMPSDKAIQNLRQHAVNEGVDPARLIFAKRELKRVDHLRRLQLADLFLDTFHFNAHTTAADSLWAGVPVLTMLGNTFASRVAGSQLTALGVTELIAHSEEEYFSKALELATNPQLLKTIRSKVENNRLISPLFDSNQYIKDLETLYIEMLEPSH